VVGPVATMAPTETAQSTVGVRKNRARWR
jgi:hypothetical protein